MNMRRFGIGVGCAFFSNIYITQRATLRDKDGTPRQAPKARQLLPATLGLIALCHGMKNKDAMSLGYGAGMIIMQILRYLTDCYDAQDEHCKAFTFVGMGIS